MSKGAGCRWRRSKLRPVHPASFASGCASPTVAASPSSTTRRRTPGAFEHSDRRSRTACPDAGADWSAHWLSDRRLVPGGGSLALRRADDCFPAPSREEHNDRFVADPGQLVSFQDSLGEGGLRYPAVLAVRLQLQKGSFQFPDPLYVARLIHLTGGAGLRVVATGLSPDSIRVSLRCTYGCPWSPWACESAPVLSGEAWCHVSISSGSILPRTERHENHARYVRPA